MSVCGSPKISVCRPSLPMVPSVASSGASVGFPRRGESDPSPGFSSHAVLPGLSFAKAAHVTQERRLWQHKHSEPCFSLWGAAGLMFSLAPAATPLPQSESPTASVFLQVLAPLPESSEAHRGQVFPPEQEHDYATDHEAVPAARGGCQPGAELGAPCWARGETQTRSRSSPLPGDPGFDPCSK